MANTDRQLHLPDRSGRPRNITVIEMVKSGRPRLLPHHLQKSRLRHGYNLWILPKDQLVMPTPRHKLYPIQRSDCHLSGIYIFTSPYTDATTPSRRVGWMRTPSQNTSLSEPMADTLSPACNSMGTRSSLAAMIRISMCMIPRLDVKSSA